MRKWSSAACIFLGAVLMASALLLFVYNSSEDQQAGNAAEAAVVEIRKRIEQQSPQQINQQAPGQIDQQNPERSDQGDETVQNTSSDTKPQETLQATEPAPKVPDTPIENYDYMGYVSIPKLKLELPVMTECTYERLKIAPCRQFGSPQTDNFVIVAHNYRSHFGKLEKLAVGETVTFTDMEGIVYTYVVENTTVLQPDMVDEVENSGYYLVVYTCTYGGKTRVAVFCNRS